jgi:hypothetical protein
VIALESVEQTYLKWLMAETKPASNSR